jgi:inorganic triphosphatase YgiF
MNEFELKLEVPPEREAAVREAFARLAGTRAERLRAIYYDTPSRALQQRRISLRVRLEGDHWVQTAKADSGRPLERFEHAVAVGSGRKAPPTPDVRLHEGTSVGRALREASGDLASDVEWVPLFETDVQRTVALVDEGAWAVEIAFDVGRIVAGADRSRVCELEFELKEGVPAAAVALARQWREEHGLWLSSISKSQKGLRLADGKPFGPPAMARRPEFGKRASLRRIAGEALAAALEQVLSNASEIAAGSGDDAHIHQLRVGIRRTRTVLRELLDGTAPGEEEALVQAFRELGRHRDLHHVIDTVAPIVSKAGGPELGPLPDPGDVPEPGSVVRAAAFQDALLSLVGLAHELCADAGPRDGGAKDAVVERLAALSRKALKDGQRFAGLDDVRQHRVRKRLKRLRYLSEFTAGLFPPKQVGKYLERLKEAQEALGLYNDELTALATYRSLAPGDGRAWFAVGWLEANKPDQARVCQKLLRRLAKAKVFWD